MRYFVTYSNQTKEIIGLTATNELTSIVNQQDCTTLETSWVDYQNVRKNRYGAYVENDTIVLKPPKNTPYDDWDSVNNQWVINTQRQLEGLTFEAREKRDQLLTEMDAVVSNPLRWASFSEVKKQEWMDYRQALLDVPQQANFPFNIQSTLHDMMCLTASVRGRNREKGNHGRF